MFLCLVIVVTQNKIDDLNIMELIVLLSLLGTVSAFTFLYPSISVSDLTINIAATYSFYVFRNQDDNLNPTPYASQPVPPNAIITIVFPSQFNLTASNITCSNLLLNDNAVSNFSTAIVGNNFTIINAVTTSTAVANITIILDNVTNPYPAITTDPFVVAIGQDFSSSSTTVTLSPANFQLCNITFSPSTVNTSGAMVIYLHPRNYILSKGYIQVQFPSDLQWSQDISTSHFFPLAAVTCTALSGQITNSTCAGTAATAIVYFTINSINSSRLTQPLSFTINGLFSPPTTSPPDGISLTSYSSDGWAIDTCSTTVTSLLPQTLSLTLSGNTSPLYVNSVGSLTFSFTLTDTITKNDYFRIILPTGSIFTSTAISATNLLLFFSGVTYTSSNLTLISRQSSASPTKYAGTACKILIGSYTAPPSVKTTGNFILQVYNSQNGLKMQGTATITAQANIYSMTVSASTYIINQNAIYTFTFTSVDYLTNTSFILVSFPSEVTPNITSNCLTSNFTSPANSTCSLSNNTVRLNSLTTNGISSNTYSLSIQAALNPNRAISALTFSASFYYINDSSYLVATANFTGLVFLPNTLNPNTTIISLSDYHVSVSPISANVTFTTKDAISAYGYCLIYIPVEISIVTAYTPQCIFTSGASTAAATCYISSQIFNVSFGNRVIAANQTITIGLNSFGINPKTTRPTSSLQLYLYSPDGYLVNYINSSIPITGFLPVDYNFLTITPSNYTNNAVTQYSFYLMQSVSWDNNSYLLIKIPATMSFPSGSPLCTNVNTNTTLSCNIINSTSLNISLAAAGVSITLSLSLVNPPSFRPTSAFTVSTMTYDGYLYAIDNSIRITTTSPSLFVNLTYSFSNPYYNQSTNLTISMTSYSAIATSFTLTNINQFISSQNITCKSQTATVMCNINGIVLSIYAMKSSFPINADFTLINLMVPMANVTQMTLSSYDGIYLMSTYSPISFTPACSLPCYTCVSSSPSVCLSCYPNTLFTNQVYYYSNNCYTTCPAGTFSANGSTICLACSNSCAECVNSSSQCTECVANSSSQILYLSNNSCISACPAGTYNNSSNNLTKYTPVCSSCQSPCSTCLSVTLCLSCSNTSLFYYNNQCISSCPSLITIANATSMQCEACSSGCLTCINSTTTCLSCNTSIAPIYYAQNHTCVNSCPSPLVVDGSNCSACASPCITCSNNKNNCTSCVNGTFLSMVLNGTCLSTCDLYYFGNITTLQCQSCSSVLSLNCQNCIDSTRCKTCDPGFVFFTANSSCLSFTPSGYTNISGIAVACVSNCSECNGVTYNCTACSGIYFLYSFAGTGYCQQNCPNTTLPINNTCAGCTYPCLSCSTLLSNCTSCITGYLIQNNSSISCVSSCPNATFYDAVTSNCLWCASPCLNCLGNANYCISCQNNSYYISNHTCVNSCPNSSLVDTVTKTCYSCLSPCFSCSVSANNCTSCQSGYYFYAASNQCFTLCPTSISVADPNGTYTCVSCNSNCYTCSILPNNCSSCVTNYSLYNSLCVSSCPSGFYSSSSKCVTCINNCSTCSTATYCLSCLNSSLMYQSQCLTSCPVSASIIINGTCKACSNSCLNCSSSDVCFSCPSNTALYNGSCVTSCPSPLSIYYNSSSSMLECFTSTQIASQNLKDTLQITSILPLPFTIITTFLFLCCLMSKIQNIDTYLFGVGYSLYGVAEVGSFAYLFYIYSIGYSFADGYSLYWLLMVINLGIIMLLNIMSLIFVTWFLISDPQFKNWLNYKPRGTPQKNSIDDYSSEDRETNGSEEYNKNVECLSHSGTFAFFTIMAAFTSYKLKVIIFTKLFRFNCLTAHLQNIHGFRAFNIFSFFGILHEGLTYYIAIKFLLNYGFSDSKLYLATIDCLIVTVISFILAFVTSQKDENFFKIHNDFKKGVDLGRRKKDKDLKNFKIDEDRLKGMNSRDKLIDVGQEHTQIQEEIIVNHNIISPDRPKKVGNYWVQVDPDKKKGSPRNQNNNGTHNVFDVSNEYDDDGYVPMTEKQRVQLFHTSVKPLKNKKNISPRLMQSRVDDWVQVNMDNQLIDEQSQYNQKSNRKVIFNSELQKQIYNVDHKKKTRNLNLQQQTVNVNVNDRVSKATIIEPKILAAAPLIEENDNQLLNKTIEQASVNKSYESILPFVHQNGVLREKTQKLKKTEQQKSNNLMIINLAKQSCFKIENHKKNSNDKVDMAVVANSQLFEEGKPEDHQKIRFIQQKQVDLLEESHDYDIIKEQRKEKQQSVHKQAQSIQVQDLEPDETKVKDNYQKRSQNFISSAINIVVPSESAPIVKQKSNKKLKFSEQMNEIVRPLPIGINSNKINQADVVDNFQQHNAQMPVQSVIQEDKKIVHAPRIYKSTKILKNIKSEDDEFDNQLQKRVEQLNNIREKCQKTAHENNQNIESRSKSQKRNKSRQSIKSYIQDTLKQKQSNTHHQNVRLIVNKEQNDTAILQRGKRESSQEANQIQVIKIVHDYDSKPNKEDISDSAVSVQQTVKNIKQQTPSKPRKSQYNPSEFIKKTETQQNYSQQKNSKQTQRNIFDREVYMDSLNKQSAQFTQKNSQQQKNHPKNQLSERLRSNVSLNSNDENYVRDESYTDNARYVINVEKEKENQVLEKQSQHIQYQPSEITSFINKEERFIPSQRYNVEKQENSQQSKINEDQISERNDIKSIHQDENNNEQRTKQKFQISNKQKSDQEENHINYHTEDKQIQQLSNQQRSIPQVVFKVQEKDEKYELQQKERDNFHQNLQQKVSQHKNFYKVEYDDNNFGSEENSRKEYTVENVNKNYLEGQDQNIVSQSNQLSMQLKKTYKRPMQIQQQSEVNQPIRFTQGIVYQQSKVAEQEDSTVPKKRQRSTNKQQIENKQKFRQKEITQNEMIDLIKNVKQKVRNKKSMPKEEKDERISINIGKNVVLKPSVPHQDNNITRKSMQKNKPLNQFKFQKKNQEYDQEQKQPYGNHRNSLKKNMTDNNFVHPSNLMKKESLLRESNTVIHLIPKQAAVGQLASSRGKNKKEQQIKQFDFGDQFSSDQSKNRGISQAELVRWRHEFVKEGSVDNFEAEFEKNEAPQHPIINKGGISNQVDELQVIEERNISGKKSKRSKQKTNRISRQKRSQLERIYEK